MILLLTGSYLFYSILTSPIDSFNSVLAGLTYLVFLIYSIYYLFTTLDDQAGIEQIKAAVTSK